MKQTGQGDAPDPTQKFTFNPKEGIDNPALVISDDSEPTPGPMPHLCVLNRVQGDNFGFHLYKEREGYSHVVQQVKPWSTAERGGLRKDDCLLEVNGEFAPDISHHRMAQKIKVCGTLLCLLVLSNEDYEQAVAGGHDLRQLTRTYHGEGCARPRLCYITKDPSFGFGMSITSVQGRKGQYSVSVTGGGPAEHAGVCSGDSLVWINGATASDLTYSALNKMVKKCEDHLTILVIDSESEWSYTSHRHPILPTMAASHNLPHRPTDMHLVQGSNGYGFLLRQEKLRSGHTVHMLREIDADSPAEQAGMQDGDELLAVNGEIVEALEHDDIVYRVRQSGQQVTLTIIHSHGREFFIKLGLPPLLFHDDILSEDEYKENFPVPAQSLHALSPMETQGNLPCPRLCVLERGPLGFGFHLGCIPHESCTFITQVATGGSGEKAGLFEGDVVVEVNGENVEEEYIEDVVLRMKEGGETLRMLVVERWGYKMLKKQGMVIKPGLVIQGS